MVADYLQQDLVSELREIFKDDLFRMPGKISNHGETGEEKKPEFGRINVYAQALPVPKPAEMQQEETDPEIIEEGLSLSDIENSEDPYPYIIVRVEGGNITEINGDQTVRVNLIFGAYDDSYENQGHRDVLHMIQKIYERFAKNAILASRYECVMPMEWALQDEESYPYFFGGMAMNFNTLFIGREDKYV